MFLTRLNLGTYAAQVDPSVRARFDSLQDAWPGIEAHPILGNGAGSFAVGHQDSKGNPGWLPNLESHVLYDSGLIGLACWLGGVAGLIWASGRVLLRGKETEEFQWTTLGLLGALAALLMAFQVTEGSWLAFPWVYVGLLARAGSMGARSTVPAVTDNQAA
jgi:O-antigen ligase